MRMLGIRTSIPVYRWDLVYLLAGLLADDRPEVAALAPPVEGLIAELKAERDAFEQAEDASLIMAARRERRDEAVDTVLIELGGVARVKDKPLYDRLFSKYNPSKTARLPLADEIVEMDRIAGELAALPVDHVVRVEYEGPVTASLAALRGAMTSADQASVALSLARTRLERFKLRADQMRLETHGKLLSILKDKDEADSFFRPTKDAPDGKSEEAKAPEKAPAPEVAAPPAG